MPPSKASFETWEMTLTVQWPAGQETIAIWRICSIRCFFGAAWTSCMPCGASSPVLAGFRIRAEKSGSFCLAAEVSRTKHVADLRRMQTWICHGLEELNNAQYGVHPEQTFADLDWPWGGRAQALAHLRAAEFGLERLLARDLAASCAFAGIECPVCLEPWSSLGEAPVLALRCGHGCCEECLNSVSSTVGFARTSCPACRAPLRARPTQAHFPG